MLGLQNDAKNYVGATDKSLNGEHQEKSKHVSPAGMFREIT